MTAEYTPTTAEVRANYSWSEANEAMFDRWLAAHDADVKAEALREAAVEVGNCPANIPANEHDDNECFCTPEPNERQCNCCLTHPCKEQQ